MRNRYTESLAISCWLTAALLLLFGLGDARLQTGSAGTLEALLGIAWVPVGFVVRSGGPTGRTVGLVAGGLTTIIGAGVLLSGQGYFVGTITAMFLVARLAQNKDAFGVASGQAGRPAYGQPPQYGQPQYGQPQYGQPQYGQPQYGQPQPAPTYYGQPQNPYQQPQTRYSPPPGQPFDDGGYFVDTSRRQQPPLP